MRRCPRLLVRACGCSKTMRSAAADRAAAAVCASTTSGWRGAARTTTPSGAAEREIAAGVDLAALQTKVQETGDSLVAA